MDYHMIWEVQIGSTLEKLWKKKNWYGGAGRVEVYLDILLVLHYTSLLILDTLIIDKSLLSINYMQNVVVDTIYIDLK